MTIQSVIPSIEAFKLRKSVLKLLAIFVFCMVSFTTSTFAQKERYQSLFIFNFTKYIKWPESYNSDKFVIGVIGNSTVYDALADMAPTKKAPSGQSIEVKKYNSPEEIGECHILFVSQNVAGEMETIDSITSSKPVLIITESPGLATLGSIINFVEKDDKIKFELNESKAQSRGLAVSRALADLAIII